MSELTQEEWKTVYTSLLVEGEGGRVEKRFVRATEENS